MFKNKHVVIAMIVAPILSVLAWIAVGQLGGEQPREAKPGESYPLVEQSNCRYVSGACDLRNEDFKLRLTLDRGAAGPEFVLTSSHPLQGVILSVGVPEQNALEPTAMRPSDGQGLLWRIVVNDIPEASERIRLVARASDSSYYAEASTTFLQSKE